MKLSIITLNYKTPLVTNECIDATQNALSPAFKKGQLEHIVVDNHSEDNSSQVIKQHIQEKKYSTVKFFESPKNGGFGAGNNFGVIHAKGEYLLFLNSDTRMHDDGILKMLTYLEETESAGVIGGQLTNKNGTPQVSAWNFYTLPNLILLLLGFERLGLISSISSSIRNVDWVTGGCFMIKKDVFEKVGKFDENIFMYTEDMELCFRVRQAGYDVYYYPHVSITHLSQRSSNREFAIVHIYKGILYFYKKHKPSWQYYVVKSLLKSKAAILILLGRVVGNAYLFNTYEKAFAVS